MDLACELSFFHLDEVVKIKEMRSVVTGKFDERTSLCSFRSDKHTEMKEQRCVFPDDMERQTSLDYSASPLGIEICVPPLNLNSCQEKREGFDQHEIICASPVYDYDSDCESDDGGHEHLQYTYSW